MSTGMLQFVDTKQEFPESRVPLERCEDFAEIYRSFAMEKAKAQSSRCSQCGVPFCQEYCPLHNNIPDWLCLVAEGRFKEAYHVSQETNTFPEICGKICPQDRLCEGNCVLEHSGHGTVTIGAVEQFITEMAWSNGWVASSPPKSEYGESIGIIGSGPAGLAAAERLRARGFQVTIYDRHDRVGGLLVYGIPDFKLDKKVVARREKQLRDMGVEFRMSCNVGHDVAFHELQNRHSAVLVATGACAYRSLSIPGSGMNGIVQAMDYLQTSNRVTLGDSCEEYISGRLNAEGRNVIVLGGGDTAMDCVRTAIRQGADSVRCLYRRDRSNMPGSAREVKNAEEEGVEFVWMRQPRMFIGEGSVSGVQAVKMQFDSSDVLYGRRNIVEMKDEVEDFAADMVVQAMGFYPENLSSIWSVPDMKACSAGKLVVSPDSYMTTLDKVYAAGDIVRGPSLVVWAISDGRKAADNIIKSMLVRA